MEYEMLRNNHRSDSMNLADKMKKKQEWCEGCDSSI